MRSIQSWFDEYGHSHQNPTNKLIHWVCVPLIFFSVLGLLAAIPVPWLKDLFPESWQAYIHLATVLVLLGIGFYLRLSLPMAAGIILFCALCLHIIALVETSTLALWLVSLIIFVAAWIGQFIGHKIEGAKPSFLKDLQFLLIGPAWLLGFVYRKLGIKY